MDKEGYYSYLTNRENPIPEKEIDEAIRLVERFEKYVETSGKTLDSAGAEEMNEFSGMLIAEEANTYQNYVALSRYGYFVKNYDLYLAVLELLDGAEVMNVLHERLAEIVGEELRDQVLAAPERPPLGLPSKGKISVTKDVMQKMKENLDEVTCKKVLSEVAHGLPRDFRKGEREKYLEAGSVDGYLKKKRESAIAELERHRDSGALFFNQMITDDVVDFVRSRPDVLTGERRGNTIYHTKIPYMTKEYLAESDERMKRYYACHCAWARESILNEGAPVPSGFCYCSAGFTKMPWEAALGQPLEVEMVKSVLRGDTECAFVIHLPEHVT